MTRATPSPTRWKLRVACGRSRRISPWRGHADTAKPKRSRGASREEPKLADVAVAMAKACDAAAAGFELCARRSRDQTIAVAARAAATFLRSLFDSTVAAANERGVDARPRARTCDRLRWEWLASTAMVVDGTPDSRLLAECARILSEVDSASARGLGDEVVARYRLALAEARSLAFASEHIRCPPLPSPT